MREVNPAADTEGNPDIKDQVPVIHNIRPICTHHLVSYHEPLSNSEVARAAHVTQRMLVSKIVFHVPSEGSRRRLRQTTKLT